MRIIFRSNISTAWTATEEARPPHFFAKRISPSRASPASTRTFATWTPQKWISKSSPSQASFPILRMKAMLWMPRSSATISTRASSANTRNGSRPSLVRPFRTFRASIDEMRRALDELGMVGVTAGTTVLGKSIADPAFDGFFSELNRRKAVLFIHPIGGSAGSPLIESTKLTWPIGAPLEDTICLLQFMQANIPSRFPDIKIILPHLGGFAPFLIARLDQLKGHFLPDSAAPPSVQAKYFWYDTVNANPSALRCTQEAVGTDRLLFGTDYPFWRDDAFKLCADYIAEAGLPKADVDRILDGNAQRLLMV